MASANGAVANSSPGAGRTALQTIVLPWICSSSSSSSGAARGSQRSPQKKGAPRQPTAAARAAAPALAAEERAPARAAAAVLAAAAEQQQQQQQQQQRIKGPNTVHCKIIKIVFPIKGKAPKKFEEKKITPPYYTAV